MKRPTIKKRTRHKLIRKPCRDWAVASEIAQMLLELRLKLGLSQTEMAKRMGRTVPTYYSWEHAERCPGVDTERVIREFVAQHRKPKAKTALCGI